ncbi:MAG: universal stress protein [Flavobacteriales bacterium]|nr:universal stress protein [Flavobacteriales bacterium]
MSTERTVKHIFHPTDLSAASSTAFLHALRLALASHASLTILHVGGDREDWDEMPQVRRTLKKWGLLKDDMDPNEFLALGLGVKKLLAHGSDPLQTCTDYLDKHPTDLVVLATNQEAGNTGWMKRRVAEPLLRASGATTLFIPHDRAGFVEPSTGKVALKRMLLPISPDPDPLQAVRAATLLADHLTLENPEFTLLFVGTQADMPWPPLPERNGWTWKRTSREGEVVGTILAMEKEINADLIVMATKGHDGFLDALRGSTTERVLRGTHCPMLTGVI